MTTVTLPHQRYERLKGWLTGAIWLFLVFIAPWLVIGGFFTALGWLVFRALTWVAR